METYTTLTAEALCQVVRDKLEMGDVGGALHAIEELTTLSDKDPVQNTSIITLKSRYAQIQQRKISGGLTIEQELNLNSQLTDSILLFLTTVNLKERVISDQERVISDLAETQKAVKLNEETLKGNERKINEIDENLDKLTEKLTLALNVEVAKERITKLGECWEAMYIFENRLFRIVKEFIEKLLEEKVKEPDLKEKLSALGFNRGLDDMYTLLDHKDVKLALNKEGLAEDQHAALLSQLEEAFEAYYDADLVLEKNKFWLGFDIYEEARRYHNCYPKFLKQYREKDYAACFTCLKNQKEAKGSIENSIKRIQDNVF
ncbi:MAG: hypothetical protein AAF824_22085 [Bacteroidota bacterium]